MILNRYKSKARKLVKRIKHINYMYSKIVKIAGEIYVLCCYKGTLYNYQVSQNKNEKDFDDFIRVIIYGVTYGW